MSKAPCTLRVAGFAEESIVDGPGVRFTIFVQGCRKNCPGCQNPQTHDPAGGAVMDCEAILAKIAEDPLVSGVTFSGGEPFLQPEPLVRLARAVRARGLGVMAFSGYTCEELVEKGREDPAVMELLDELDCLVDGPFVEELKDLELEFRGSSNQRILVRKDIAEIKAKVVGNEQN